VQALYQWEIAGSGASEIEAEFLAERLPEVGGNVDRPYFQWLLRTTLSTYERLDELYAPWLDRPPERLDPVERAILRLAVLELSARVEIPLRVVLDEAIELAKLFGAEQSHRYVNGVLDRAARELRAPPPVTTDEDEQTTGGALKR